MTRALSPTRRGVLAGAASLAALAAGGRAARAADTVVGMIYVGPRDDFGWNQAHAVGAQAVRELRRPLMILHSDNDRSVPIANALLMVEALKKAEAEFVFHRYPSAGHMGITEEVIKRTLEFIEAQ